MSDAEWNGRLDPVLRRDADCSLIHSGMCWCFGFDAIAYRFQRHACLLVVAVLLANVISRGWSQQQQVPISPVSDYVNLPPEYSSSVPERLCFSATDLALCVSDNYARNCILKGELVLAGGDRSHAGLGRCVQVAGLLTYSLCFSFACVADSVVLDPNSWPQSFKNGNPVLQPEQRNFTISSGEIACWSQQQTGS
jgi:hypothetical protein